MPINLPYGQKAVEHGYITQQRLQQVLQKQKQLAEQGKKVSVRMILEKSRLLNAGQLQKIDNDLNIRVVKKKSAVIQRGSVPLPKQPRPSSAPPQGAQNFKGEAPPEFTGMGGGELDVTLFSPPPPEVKDKIRAEREKAREEARRRHEEDAADFLAANDDMPFGDDPFGGPMMSPEPAEEMFPEEAEDYAGGYPADAAQPVSLERTDSSPHLGSFHDDFGDGEHGDLPTLSAFDDEPEAGLLSTEPVPLRSSDPSPGAGRISSFGTGIRSPEELEASVPPPKDMDATVFSPVPPDRGRGDEFQMPGSLAPVGHQTPVPDSDNWGEESAPQEPAEIRPSGASRHGAEEFGDVDIPVGKQFDDVPTVPARGEDPHPLRRGVGTSSSSSPLKSADKRKPSSRVPENIADTAETPMMEADEPPFPEADEAEDPAEARQEEEAVAIHAPTGTLPKLPGRPGRKSEKTPAAATPARADKPRKRTAPRLLLFVILLLLVVAVLWLPVVLYEQVPQVRALRDHPRAKKVYDYVEDIHRSLTGAPPRVSRPEQVIPAIVPDVPPPEPLPEAPDTPPTEQPEGEGNGGEQDTPAEDPPTE
jgi:hypothetical protein